MRPVREGISPEALEAMVKFDIQKDLGLNLGPIILGYAFDSLLLGVLVQQTIWNLIWSPRERLFTRIILFSAVLLAGAMTIFNDAFLFHTFALGFGHWYRLLQLDYVMWFPILDSATVTLVQAFYLERAYQLHGRAKWVPCVVIPFILASIGGALGATITAAGLPDAYEIKNTFPSFYTWIGATLVTDGLITSIIFYRLVKSKTGWSDTDYLINRLLAISVETQLPALIVTAAFMISYGVRTVAGLNIFFEMFHPKVYVVGLLAVLNSRQSLKDKISPPVPDSRKANTFGKRNLSSILLQRTIVLDEYEPDGTHLVPSLLVTVDRLEGVSENPSEVDMNLDVEMFGESPGLKDEEGKANRTSRTFGH